MNNSQLGQELGRLFEVGFNIGMLTYIKQKKLKCNYEQIYEKDLAKVSFSRIVRRLIDSIGIISPQHQKTVKQWATFFLQKSFLAGLNFLEEYLTAIDWKSDRKLKRLEVVYFQAYFANDNTIGTYLKGENQVYRDWLSQLEKLGINIEKFNYHKYQDKGEFLKADSLIYFRYKHQVRILTIDYSIFTIQGIRDLTDLNSIEVLRQILLSNISYIKSKSVFANLGLDSKNDNLLFSESLSQYYQAFARKDKETIKMIQAGSYAYSFYNWLKAQQQILPEDEVTFNIIGYSDRDLASLSLQQKNIKLLETCYNIYRHKSVESELDSTRKKVLSTIKRKAKRSFVNGDKFVDNLLSISNDGINLVSHQPIEAKLKEFSQRIKHIFIAIDEITGDRSGADFLLGISKRLNQYGLTNKNYFNTKIIVADASIIDADVIKQHLADTTAEPNKIFVRKALQIKDCLTTESFTFKNSPAIAINTNSYPASQLKITYKTFVQSLKFQEQDKEIYYNKKLELEKHTQTEIIDKIEQLLTDYPKEQIIVYIQDKTRLSNLIETIKSNRNQFKAYQDYLEIHADLSELDKQKVSEHKDKVRVIFMTASASRGLSFPRTKHILVDFPRFEIEANLMEVIQVIYRGRGNPQIDKEEKQVIFYLTEQAIYYLENEEDRKYSLQESTLNLLDFLIILHVSIKTRIYGYGNIARENYMMIPVGGKSVFTAGQSLSDKIKNLIKNLKKEHRKRKHDLRLQRAYQQLEDLMKTADITIQDTVKKNTTRTLSYLKLLDDIRQAFIKQIEGNLNVLLDFPEIQTGYVLGSLLIVSIGDKKVDEVYRLKIDDKSITLTEILSELEIDTRLSENIQGLIRETLQLVKELEQQKYRHQKLEQENQYSDRYYAVPLFIFLVNETFTTYFKNKEVEPEDRRFRDILEVYVSSIFPISQVIPIGYKYEQIPFLIFRSYSLKEMRHKQFSDQYLMNSKELNLLNLILARSETY